ncbi:10579_t:CDS:10 [Paraglomus brasilianum]|uniref:10579_t:CDS:1 n=1 Tax=Paraglomus brasilianum TaxID=144538 RepID=A0A9N9DFU4_9GLOM|nr:10579_t:CDS:10 [Paraglomus brasilianum]
MTSSTPIKLQDFLNKRVQVEDQLATVRYVGPVPPTKGEWLGVEWDNVSRGRHDGVHEGVRYFTCSTPNSGSFIRFTPKITAGRSFLSALINKYIDDEMKENDYNAQNDLETLHWAGNRRIEVEALGWDKVRRKQSHLDRLTEVGLSFEQISNAGVPGEIEAGNLNIIDLNLSKNLLSDWENVAHICEQLKKLQILRLNYNRFQPLQSPPQSIEGFKNLKSLSLNYTRISWSQVQLLEPCLPNLENLQLGFNNMHHFGTSDTEKSQPNGRLVCGFHKLKILNLESNGIDSWEEVARFSKLESLEVLFLTTNKLDKILYPSNAFPKLRLLILDENKIADWTNVDELNKFPALKELRIKNNPFSDGVKQSESNASLIGRVKGLTMLNGSTIAPGDRADAERYYLRLCVREFKTPEEIEKKHPRYKELCEIHGTPTADELLAQSMSGMLKDRLITVVIIHRTSLTDSEHIKKVTKRLLGTMTIRSLKNILQKLFGVPPFDQCLFRIPKMEEGMDEQEPVEMNDDLRELSYYDLAAGDEIILVKTE